MTPEDVSLCTRAVTGADMVTFQLLDRGRLRLVGNYGFKPPFLDFFHIVGGDDCACGTALEHNRQIVVPDIHASPIFAGKRSLDVMHAAGSASVISTPLLGRDGRLFGMLSTHMRQILHPTEKELESLQWLARSVSAALRDEASAEARMLRTVAKWERMPRTACRPVGG